MFRYESVKLKLHPVILVLMIRLSLHIKSNQEIHLFDKVEILIGRDPSLVDLALPDPLLQPIHLKIIEQHNSFVLINLTNDPFVSLNGFPFGKTNITSGDTINLNEANILFEKVPLNPATSQQVKESFRAETLDSNIKQQTAPLPLLGSNAEPISTYQKELKAIKEPTLTEKYKPSNPELPSYVKTNKKGPGSLKDDYLKDLEDDNSNNQIPETGQLFHEWRWIFLFIFSIFTIAGVLGTVIYLSVSDKTDAQETKAAQGVADIAMALMHAHFYHLKPSNQNWSDVEFLKKNLQSILPDTFSYALDIDSHGQFGRFPYSWRIYTSNDLSRFLLIAQPAPSLLQWLIPKSVILVDSQAMELRTIKDVRNINRLLANSEPLEGVNGKEIAALVKQGTLIRLANLNSHSDPHGFTPPKNLEWIHTGAENYIHNAPRYYRLGQSLIQKAISLSTSKGSSQEVTLFKHEVESFSNLNYPILYAKGKFAALQTRDSLSIFAPNNKFLFGFISWDSNEKILHATLLNEKDEGEIAELSTPVSAMEEKNPTGINTLYKQAHAIKTSSQKLLASKSIEKSGKIDFNHPLYAKLRSLKNARESELLPLSLALKELLDAETSHPSLSFQTKHNSFVQRYYAIDEKHKKIINETLNNLFQQYNEIPIDQFLVYVLETGCGNLICQTPPPKNALLIQTHLEKIIINLNEAKTFKELDNLIHIGDSLLTFEHIKNPHELMRYQNRLRNEVLCKLEKMILSDKKISIAPNSSEKEALKHILSHERLIKPEERTFFLDDLEP